ncbi:HEPN domain-containing protein [Marinobacter nauticus]|uniref:HEPN domain-containing protein n=1 Tax=Marinobacter nauticus TaxID=2743 RepID=UPI001675081F|nr:HEPN domain-containing protein [Marinobacter nauticus]
MEAETPEGFLKHAQEFCEAAELVCKDDSTVSLPGYFLLGRSVELSLKAFLLKCGFTVKTLRSRPYGHDLRQLLQAAQENGLANYVDIGKLEGASIHLLSHDYVTKRLEYRQTGQEYALPFLAITIRITRELAYGLSEFCVPEA